MQNNSSHLPAAPRKSRKHWYFGMIGLMVGLAAGLLLAMGGGAGETVAPASAIPEAVATCGATKMMGVNVLNDGASLKLGTAGEESEGTSMLTVVCVLTQLEAPESLFSRMESTRAMDGTQDAAWGNYTASWNYHPDDGMNIIVETTTK